MTYSHPDCSRAAYEAFCAYSKGKSLIVDAKFPSWERLPSSVKAAWDRAAEAVIKRLTS